MSRQSFTDNIGFRASTCCRRCRQSADLLLVCFASAVLTSRRVFKLNICSRLKTDSADDKVVCSWSVFVKTDLLQICCRSARFVRAWPLCTSQLSKLPSPFMSQKKNGNICIFYAYALIGFQLSQMMSRNWKYLEKKIRWKMVAVILVKNIEWMNDKVNWARTSYIIYEITLNFGRCLSRLWKIPMQFDRSLSVNLVYHSNEEVVCLQMRV